MDLVRAVPPFTGAQVFGLLHAIMHLTFSWYIAIKIHTNQAEGLALVLHLFVNKKEYLTSNFLLIAESCVIHVQSVNYLPCRSSDR